MSRSVAISWGGRGRMYLKPDHAFYDRLWRKAKAKSYRSTSEAGYSRWDNITNAASLNEFERHKRDGSDEEPDPLLSAEALPENSSLISFKVFAREYPEKLFALLHSLRPDFQELFIEYYLLEKSQYFLADVHGQIQTRIWQKLRIIEQAIGALIILGQNPTEETLRPILQDAGIETTEYGSLAVMILKYAENQNYANVATKVGAPTPAIRKIFRPAIAALLASKDLKTVAVGAYLRSLTHQASLTGAGLSKRYRKRTNRVKQLHFTAPPRESSPLISFGNTASIAESPWCLFETSAEQHMDELAPVLRVQGKRLFGKKPAQIFAPLNADGDLAFGYFFARSTSISSVHSLTRIRGVSEMSAVADDDTANYRAVLVPNEDVQKLMKEYGTQELPLVHLGDFVEVLTGDAARYCGTITSWSKITNRFKVEVTFPTGRKFIVTADPSGVKLLPTTPKDRRGFWGITTAPLDPLKL